MRPTRQAPFPLQRPSSRPPARLLSAITLGVLLGHWVLLSGAPLSLGLPSAPDAAPALTFTTRSVAASAPAVAVAQAAAPVRARKPRATPPTPNLRPPEPHDNALSSDEPHDTAPMVDHAAPQADATALAAASPTGPASSASPSAAAEAPPQAPPAAALAQYRYPAPVRLKFDVKGKEKGFPFFASGELLWQHDGVSYDARLQISHFLLGKVSQTSVGQLTEQGLEPRRFGDKRRSEVAAHFERSKGKVTFSANTPDVPLQTGTQDNLSGWLQLASTFAGAAGQVPSGTQLTFLSVGPRSAETWTLTVGTLETLTLPGGEVSAIHLTRASSNENDGRGDVWLAPSLDYLPVRILVSWGEDHFLDQQWSATEKP